MSADGESLAYTYPILEQPLKQLIFTSYFNP